MPQPPLRSLYTATRDACYEVHRALGPGLLESAYQRALEIELSLRNIPFIREAPIHLIYKGEKIENAYRADFIVDSRIIIETKSVDTILPVHHRQIQNYLNLTKLPLGILVNFRNPKLVDNFHNWKGPTFFQAF